MILTFFNREGRSSEARFFQASKLRANWWAGMLVASAMLAVFVLPVSQAFAQQFTTTGNAFVSADVYNSSGIIGIYLTNTHPKEVLTNQSHSYLTIQVGGDFFTNNDNGAHWVEPANDSVAYTLLSGGQTSLVKDTVRTKWQPKGAGAFDIIQDVYPVQGVNSGQIVYRWSVLNHESTFLPVQVQYLLDVETSSNSPTYSTEIPAVTTRAGYNSGVWQDITSVPYFLTTEYDLCTGTPNFPGILGAGFTVDTLAPFTMGLTQPSSVAIVDWVAIVPTYLWGFPNQLGSVMGDNDNAILLQWPASGVSQNTEQEVGRGCFGTPPCEPVTFGNLDALLLHVDHVVWGGPTLGYVPNHFPVEAIVWNFNTNSSAHGALTTQTITNSNTGLKSGPVRVVSPLPVTSGGFSQTHAITSGGSMRPDSAVPNCSAAFSTWEDTVLEGILVNCSTDSSYDIKLNLTATGVQQPIFSFGLPVCPVIVDCEEKDVLAPRHTKHIYSDLDSCGNPLKCTIDSVYDNLPTDLGVQSIVFTESPQNSVTVTGTNVTGGCPGVVGPITMTQTDTLRDACVYFTYTDCAGNVSLDTVCFGHCLPGVPYDILPPKFRVLNKYHWSDSSNTNCGFQCSEWVVTDTVIDVLQQDRGLDSISVVSSQNMSFALTSPVVPHVPTMKRDSFTVCVIDSMQPGSIIIRAKDLAVPANISYDTISYCTVADTTRPIVHIGSLTGNLWPVHARDTQAWDRGVKEVRLTIVTNCKPINIAGGTLIITQLDDTTWLITPDTCQLRVDFNVVIIDSFKQACFTPQATDCVGNTSSPLQTICSTAEIDGLCPKIDTVSISPWEESVTIYDIHVQGSDTISYDEGIDSIWFTCANNITLDSAGTTWNSVNNTLHALHGKPTLSDHPKFQKVIRFTVSVTDTLSQNGEPCVCINAVDGAGLQICPPTGPVVQWCSTLDQDTAAPKVTATPTCTSLDVVATDSETFDRGVHRVWLDSLTNFAPLDDSSQSGNKVVPITLQIPEQDSSSYARLNALDVYGNLATLPGVKASHTTSTNVWVYKQDIAMNGSGIAETSTTFRVPVYLSKTDAFPISQKRLSQFQFTFHLTGTPLVSFVGPVKSFPGWTVTTSLGPNYVISGAGPMLADAPVSDTLVWLEFSAAQSPDVAEARIVIDSEQCGAQVIYNGGIDTTISSANYSITLPAPSGRLNGGTIILKDSCATIIGDHPHPTILSLAPLKPNPVTTEAARAVQIEYTVPLEAPVLLELYDELGRKVRTLVTQVQKQGTYQLQLDATPLPDGTYFLRLASDGQVCSQRILIVGK